MRLTKNFDRSEFEFSQTADMLGIDNTIPDSVISIVSRTALNLQILRSHLNTPVVITSGYRSKKLNEAIGGSKISHHMSGHAVDFIVPGVEVSYLIDVCQKIWLFDQLINEKDRWVHVSFHSQMRGEVFKL